MMRWCGPVRWPESGRLRSGGSTVLMVSHELDLLQSVSRRNLVAGAGHAGTPAAIRARCWTPTARASPKKCASGAPRSRVRMRPAHAPRRRPCRDSVARNAGRQRPADRGVAERRECSGARHRALSRRGGGAGDRDHDSHAHRPGSVRHQYGAGEGEYGKLPRRDDECGSNSHSAAICAPANTPSPLLRTTPTARRTIGWTMQWRSPLQIRAIPRAWRICGPNSRSRSSDGKSPPGYFCSRMNVGAIPDSVENPDGPTAVSQLEQPCTLPR